MRPQKLLPLVTTGALGVNKDFHCRPNQGRLSPNRPWCIPPKMAGWVPPQFLIIMNLILGPAIVSSLLLYSLLYFSCV